MASTFAMIKMCKKIKKEETSSEKSSKSQLMKKFRLSLLGRVLFQMDSNYKQGQIHGEKVADSWAGAVMRKLPGIQECDGPTNEPTNQPTDRHGKV